MGAVGTTVLVVAVAGGVGVAAYFVGRNRGRRAMAMGRGGEGPRGNLTRPTIDPKKAAAAMILSAADRNIQKV